MAFDLEQKTKELDAELNKSDAWKRIKRSLSMGGRRLLDSMAYAIGDDSLETSLVDHKWGDDPDRKGMLFSLLHGPLQIVAFTDSRVVYTRCANPAADDEEFIYSTTMVRRSDLRSLSVHTQDWPSAQNGIHVGLTACYTVLSEPLRMGSTFEDRDSDVYGYRPDDYDDRMQIILDMLRSDLNS